MVSVEQAIFGEVRSGHALRQASGDHRFAADLAPRLDLPDTAPPGADWSPYVSGFPFRDRYVLARTFKDEHAGRSGMVFAHALIAPLEAFAELEDLSPFLMHLLKVPSAPDVLADLQIEPSTCPATTDADLLAAASLLVQRASGPVVRLGHEGFESLVAGLWPGFTPGIRRTFVFRMSFGPSDLTETPQPALVCTPRTLIGRWQGYRVIDPSSVPGPSLAAGLLSGTKDGAALRAFRDETGTEPTSFGELALLAEAYRLAFAEAETFTNLIAAIRLVGRLSPRAAVGPEAKSQLLDRAIRCLQVATTDEILLLRNIDLSAFKTSDRLWAALKSRVAQHTYSTRDDGSFLAVLSSLATPDEAIDAWHTAVAEGLCGAGRNRNFSIAAAFWRLAEQGGLGLATLWGALRLGPGEEDAFVAAAPLALSTASAEAIVDLAATARLVKLHGAAAGFAFKPNEAAARQLAVEPEPAVAGLRLALRSARPAELVAIALTMGDRRIIALASEVAAKKPSLLRSLDFSDATVQALWSETLTKNAAVWDAPAPEAFHHVLDGVLAARPVSRTLVDQLSQTDLAVVVGYARRAELWRALSGLSRERLLTATANAWIADPNTSSGTLESDLEAAILAAPTLDLRLTDLAREDIGAAIEVFRALPGFPEFRFRPWLRSALTTGRPLATTEAESIGRLIEIRSWRSSADDLLTSLRLGRNDVRSALRACIDLVGYLDRWFLNLSPISADEKWETLENVASDLFSGGPEEGDLWVRAGGHNADLITYGSGRSRWRDALQRLRRGARGPKVEKLLNEMLRDFPNSTELGFLAKDEEFDGRR